MADYIKRIRSIVGHGELLQVPSVSVAVRDPQGRVLIARHCAHSQWVLPGGTIEPGETPAAAAIREILEETGLSVELTRLIGVFGGPTFIVEYPNADRTSYVMSVFDAFPVSSPVELDGSELLEWKWVARADLDHVNAASWMAEVMDAVFTPRSDAVYRVPTLGS
jgi:8-oxo-dGTP pyrophosphatase MutT (NUDIX family)